MPIIISALGTQPITTETSREKFRIRERFSNLHITASLESARILKGLLEI